MWFASPVSIASRPIVPRFVRSRRSARGNACCTSIRIPVSTARPASQSARSRRSSSTTRSRKNGTNTSDRRPRGPRTAHHQSEEAAAAALPAAGDDGGVGKRQKARAKCKKAKLKRRKQKAKRCSIAGSRFRPFFTFSFAFLIAGADVPVPSSQGPQTGVFRIAQL